MKQSLRLNMVPSPLILLVIVLLFIGALTASAFSVLDGDFSSWTIFHTNTDDPYVAGTGPNTSTGSGQRLSSGGNPGSCLQITHTFTYGDASFTGGIKTDFSYDPATQGPILGLSVAADIEASTTGSSGSSAWQLVISQSGRLYYSVPFAGFPTPTGWIRVSASGLTPTNFDTNPFAYVDNVTPDRNQPDFSSSGGVMQFGFAFGNRVLGPGTLNNTFLLDNFSVVSDDPVITAIVQETNSIRLTWTTIATKTNFIQATTGANDGGITNNFSDISPPIVVPGAGDVVTNFLDVGAVTNSPERYYRVRVVP